jgi:adiponectin receptor
MFFDGLIYFALMGVSYLTGVAIYISRVPERFYPGKFDFIGSSHNIWHLFVLSAALFHYLGSLFVYHTRQSLTCFS